ncbi:MAG: 50S ribosomal protein L11 methyltransferase [Chlamydiia bacterium]|nr:50S ribosomal protein L11 methyltransferase [Chlamydiia bacterium]
MKKWILKPGSHLDEILEWLDDRVLFAYEEEGLIQVFVKDDDLEHPAIDSVEDYVLPAIDWEQDWANHVVLKNGFLEVPAGEKVIKMLPGPGFGNLSHPTTCLMLEHMKDLCFEKTVFDIGTGSGILALAAKAMGANQVFAVDIDEEAIQHAVQNAQLNELEILFDKPVRSDITLLNMIFSEQKEALKSHPFREGRLLSSGILKEEEFDYLTFARAQGWTHEKTFESQGWLAFLFRAESSIWKQDA